jgi:hypothetical protein
LQIIGVGNVNRKLSVQKDGVPAWKRALFGKSGEEAWKAQMNLGRLLKAREESKKSMAKRKIRKVTA